MKTLQNKIIWITGASSGIGEALVYELARENAKLIISARRKEELERVKNSTSLQSQDHIQILPLDLAESESLKLMSEAAINYYGKIDILINNGGISQRSLAKDTGLEVDRKIMEVNYFSAVALAKYLVPEMISHGGGHIVNISSVLGKYGAVKGSGYSASKHALHGFFDSLRFEHWRDNIKVTMVCPGFVHTQVTINALMGDGTKFNKMAKQTAAGMPPEICAKKIVKAIKKQKEEVYMGGKEVFAIYLKRYVPRLFSRIMKKVKR